MEEQMRGGRLLARPLCVAELSQIALLIVADLSLMSRCSAAVFLAVMALLLALFRIG
jgi:hypothetical protein